MMNSALGRAKSAVWSDKGEHGVGTMDSSEKEGVNIEQILGLRREIVVLKAGLCKWRYKVLAELDEDAPSKSDVRQYVEKMMDTEELAMDNMSLLCSEYSSAVSDELNVCKEMERIQSECEDSFRRAQTYLDRCHSDNSSEVKPMRKRIWNVV